MEEIRDCPICHAPAKVLNWMNHSYVIECSKNDYQHCVYIRANSREEAIKKWNGE